jgi:hypothetical protein
MAQQTDNHLMSGVRGMIGGQIVFKQRAGKAYVSAPPDVDESRKPTPAQAVIRQRFKKAITYANAAVKDAALKKMYFAAAKRGQSAHNVAFLDAFHPPEIITMITQGYRGSVGDIIVVIARDDFKVAAVTVSIYSAVGELIETGAAVANRDGLSWQYVCTKQYTATAGCKMIAAATDLSGNEGVMEVAL